MNLEEFLAVVPRIQETERFKTLSKLKLYYDGDQYKGRRLDVSGMIKGTTISGCVTGSPNWNERDPGAVWNIRREIVEELTDWSMVGDTWCNIEVAGDRDATDWLTEALKQGQFPEAVAKSRNFAGSQKTAIASLAIHDGRIKFEAHEPINTWVVDWADSIAWRPRTVVKLFEEQLPVTFENSKEKNIKRARVWTDQFEAYYTQITLPSGQKVWRQDSIENHNLGICPVWWYPQFAEPGAYDGQEDAPNTLDLVDDANYLAGAASATTRRNADDILVIREDPSLNHGKVRKAATNAIFARGGASYLTQDGASARVCEELSERRAQRVYRAAGVVILSNEEVGKVASAEVIKRLMHRMLKRVSRIRSNYEQFFIVPICEDLLKIGRKLGSQITLPPIVEHNEKREITSTRERTPGTSGVVTLTWPEPFPPTFVDKEAAMRAATLGTGNKPVIQQRTAIKLVRSAGIDIAGTSEDEELEGIQQDESHAADMKNKALGGSDFSAGNAGPVGGKPVEEDEENEDEDEENEEDDREEGPPSSKP